MAGRLVPRQRRTILGVAVLAAASIPFLAGQASAVQFCNTTPIVFTPPPMPTQSVQTLQPYPSTINVTGLTGTITDVNVTLNDLTYTFPEDVDVLLVAPDGSTRLVVMSDIGGDNDGVADAVTDVDLTFDDEAVAIPPQDGQLTSGTFHPTDDDNDLGDFVPGNAESFPSPAPAPGPSTALSVFDGLAPNGTWSLYVVDDEPGPNIVGDFGGGWCIDISTGSTTTVSTVPTTSSSTTSSSTTSSSTTSSSTTSSTTSSSTTSTSSSTTTTRPTTTTSSSTTSSTTSSSTTSTSSSTTTTRPTTTTSSSLPPSSTTSTTSPAGTCDGRAATIVGTAGADSIFGTPGPDVIIGGGGSDRIEGLGGDDVICGGDGDDLLRGGEGNDRVFGEAGNDLVSGGNGNDFLSGGAGTDNVQGEAGNDTLNGGADSDQCVGGDGTDTAAACEGVSQVP